MNLDFPPEIKEGAVGCALSQFFAIKYAKQLGLNNFLLLEDDIQFGYPYIIEDIGVGFILSSVNFVTSFISSCGKMLARIFMNLFLFFSFLFLC